LLRITFICITLLATLHQNVGAIQHDSIENEDGVAFFQQIDPRLLSQYGNSLRDLMNDEMLSELSRAKAKCEYCLLFEDAEKARSHIAELYASHSDSPRITNLFARSLARVGKVSEAIAVVTRINVQHRSNRDSTILLAILAPSAENVEKLKSLTEVEAYAWLALAQIHSQNESYNESLACANEFLKRQHAGPPLQTHLPHLLRSQALVKVGRNLGDAARSLEQAVELGYGCDAKVLQTIWNCYYQNNDHNEAMICAEKFVAAFPESIDANFCLAMSLKKSNASPTRLLECLQLVHRAHPTSTRIANELALALCKTGRREEAKQILRPFLHQKNATSCQLYFAKLICEDKNIDTQDSALAVEICLKTCTVPSTLTNAEQGICIACLVRLGRTSDAENLLEHAKRNATLPQAEQLQNIFDQTREYANGTAFIKTDTIR
jgi:tetratricopeptide (TPR) repeat protein